MANYIRLFSDRMVRTVTRIFRSDSLTSLTYSALTMAREDQLAFSVA